MLEVLEPTGTSGLYCFKAKQTGTYMCKIVMQCNKNVFAQVNKTEIVLKEQNDYFERKKAAFKLLTIILMLLLPA